MLFTDAPISMLTCEKFVFLAADVRSEERFSLQIISSSLGVIASDGAPKQKILEREKVKELHEVCTTHTNARFA